MLSFVVLCCPMLSSKILPLQKFYPNFFQFSGFAWSGGHGNPPLRQWALLISGCFHQNFSFLSFIFVFFVVAKFYFPQISPTKTPVRNVKIPLSLTFLTCSTPSSSVVLISTQRTMRIFSSPPSVWSLALACSLSLVRTRAFLILFLPLAHSSCPYSLFFFSLWSSAKNVFGWFTNVFGFSLKNPLFLLEM